MDAATLKPARDLAQHTRRYPNESAEYRRARNDLLAEEIELRRHIERVAEQRRALPLGGPVPQDYVFQGEQGPVTLSQLFGDKPSLIVYNWMYGPHRPQPCPMCTTLLTALDGNAADIEQRAALAVVARGPIDRLAAYKRERGWRHLKVYSSGGTPFNRDYAFEDPDSDEDNPALNVFARRGDTIHHFWGGEMGPESADPGQDPRGAPDLMPLWTFLDTTPEGRGATWYPSLSYPAS